MVPKNFVVFLVLVLTTSAICQDVCVKKSSCICQFPNGTGIDLTPTAKADFYITETFEPKMSGTQWALYKFYYHPCIDIAKAFMNVTDKSTDTCSNTPLALCRQTYTFTQNKTAYIMDNVTYEIMGTNSVNQMSFDPNGKSLTYLNLPSSTVVLLTCADSDDQLEVFSLDDPKQIQLSFFSRHACLKLLEEEGRSIGSTLLIIFFSMTIFYLALGVLTKKFLMGATGLEVIPNLGFWSELPNLVKDGWAFTISGFKLPARGTGPATSPDPNSYDSI